MKCDGLCLEIANSRRVLHSLWTTTLIIELGPSFAMLKLIVNSPKLSAAQHDGQRLSPFLDGHIEKRTSVCPKALSRFF